MRGRGRRRSAVWVVGSVSSGGSSRWRRGRTWRSRPYPHGRCRPCGSRHGHDRMSRAAPGMLGRRGAVHRVRRRRGQRQVDPVVPAGRAARRGPHPRAGGHGHRPAAPRADARRPHDRPRRPGRGAADGRRPGAARRRGGAARPWRPAGTSCPTATSARRWPTRGTAGACRSASCAACRPGRPTACGPTSSSCSTCRPRWPPPRATGAPDRLEAAGADFHDRVAAGLPGAGQRRPAPLGHRRRLGPGRRGRGRGVGRRHLPPPRAGVAL